MCAPEETIAIVTNTFKNISFLRAPTRDRTVEGGNIDTVRDIDITLCFANADFTDAASPYPTR
jgi:hypothetical protein